MLVAMFRGEDTSLSRPQGVGDRNGAPEVPPKPHEPSVVSSAAKIVSSASFPLPVSSQNAGFWSCLACHLPEKHTIHGEGFSKLHHALLKR